jgi:hypothetical protein
MSNYQPIHHQFTLFDYNAMRPIHKIPIRRISKERYNEALKELRGGDDKKMLHMLRDLNDSLSIHEKRISNGKNRKN